MNEWPLARSISKDYEPGCATGPAGYAESYIALGVLTLPSGQIVQRHV